MRPNENTFHLIPLVNEKALDWKLAHQPIHVLHALHFHLFTVFEIV